MITVTLEDIINATPTLKIIAQKPLNGINAFKIARLYRELIKEVELFENERYKLIEKYGEKDENGKISVNKDNNIKIQSDYINEFNNILREMLQNKIDINANLIPVETLENLVLTPEQALSLEKFFE